jgi:hypothetical protein
VSAALHCIIEHHHRSRVAIGQAALACLLDHLIRPLQERRRDRQAEGLGGLEVDEQFEFAGLFDGRSPGFAPLRILSTNDAQ